MSSAPPLTVDELRAMLERAGLDPSRVDLEWIARVKLDTEQRILEHRSSPDFAAALAVSAVPPAR